MRIHAAQPEVLTAALLEDLVLTTDHQDLCEVHLQPNSIYFLRAEYMRTNAGGATFSMTLAVTAGTGATGGFQAGYTHNTPNIAFGTDTTSIADGTALHRPLSGIIITGAEPITLALQAKSSGTTTALKGCCLVATRVG